MDPESDNARKIKEHYDEWIRRYETAKELLPSIVRQQELSAWQVQALDTLSTSSPSMAREVDGELANALMQLRVELPLPPAYRPTIALSTSSNTAQTSIAMVVALVSVRGDNGQEDMKLDQAIYDYTALQEKQGRPDEVRQRLQNLFPNIAELFSTAVRTYQVAKVHQADHQAAALAMRNFIEKFNGELLDKARKHQKGNMTWVAMAQRLGGDRWQSLAQEEATQGRLHDLLSKIQKGWPASHSLSDVWPQFLDHVFVVCGYVLAGTLEAGK